MTINLGLIDLGQIDLLVEEGFYTNGTDLIRTAVRNQLLSHADVIHHTVARKSLVLDLQHFSRADLEAVRAARETLQIQMLGPGHACAKCDAGARSSQVPALKRNGRIARTCPG